MARTPHPSLFPYVTIAVGVGLLLVLCWHFQWELPVLVLALGYAYTQVIVLGALIEPLSQNAGLDWLWYTLWVAAYVIVGVGLWWGVEQRARISKPRSVWVRAVAAWVGALLCWLVVFLFLIALYTFFGDGSLFLH